MSKHFTRRQFLHSGLVFGAAFGLSLSGTAHMQDETPESTSEGDALGSLALTGSIRRIHDPAIIKAHRPKT